MTKSRYAGKVSAADRHAAGEELGRRDRADAAAPAPLDQVLEEIDEAEGQQHLVERGPPVERPEQAALDEGADRPTARGAVRAASQKLPVSGERGEPGVRAEHVEGAVRQVDDVEHPEDERQADREEKQQRTVRQAVQRLAENVREEGHGMGGGRGGGPRPPEASSGRERAAGAGVAHVGDLVDRHVREPAGDFPDLTDVDERLDDVV